MSDHYVQTCFAFDVTANEAGLLLQAAQAADELSSNIDVPSLTRFWSQLPEDFRALFPPTDDDPWSGFTAIFPDPEYPTFGAKFELVDNEKTAQRMMVYGDQFDPDATATLIAVIVKETLRSSQPGRARAASSVSTIFMAAFRIDRQGITFGQPARHLRQPALEPKMVLTTSNDESGPLFGTRTPALARSKTPPSTRKAKPTSSAP
ncbi:MAG: hypothetical protein IPN84_17750 [Sphingomonadales bacterium]|nr:hypothetical protein [Sphingomonadales bacterium]